MIDLTNTDMMEQFKTVPSGHVRFITETNEMTFKKMEPRMAEIRAILSAEGLDIINFHNGCVMLVDDTGSKTGRPVNQIATRLYHSMCRPGTTHEICGPVAIVRDSDFA